VLGSDAATNQMDYYDDRLLRDEGMRVPVVATKEAPKKGLSARERIARYQQRGHDFS